MSSTGAVDTSAHRGLQIQCMSDAGEPASSLEALLGRSEWTATLTVVAYGVRVVVRTNDDELAQKIPHHLPPGWQPTERAGTERVYSLMRVADDRPRCSLHADDTAVAARLPIAAALRALQSEVQVYVAEMAPERVFVHAGVVGCGGRAIDPILKLLPLR